MEGELELTVLTQLFTFNDLRSLEAEITLRFYPLEYRTTNPVFDAQRHEWFQVKQAMTTLYNTGELWYDANKGGYVVSANNPALGPWPDD